MKPFTIIALLFVLLFAGPVSAQQQFTDYSKITRLRWMGSEQPGTYPEYLASHPAQPFQIVPLRMVPLRAPSDGAAPRVLVIVNSTLQPLIQTKLDRYISDIEAKGYAADLYSSTFGTAEELKAFIVSESTGLVGCVLFGELPCAWYEVEDDYGEDGYSSFPCDLYLTELDGVWSDNGTQYPMLSGVYDSHTDGAGDTAPEIFLGRIDASMMTGDDEYIQISNYLDKLHSWYSSEMTLTNYALSYTEDDWVNYSEDDWLSYIDIWGGIGYAYPDFEPILAPNTNRDDYADNRLASQAYQFIQLACHSSPKAHYFTRGGWLNNNEIRAIPPRALFYNIFGCSASRFTEKDFLGGSYIFNPSTTALATVGSTKTGSMLEFWAFYQPLGDGKTIGQALSDWFNTIAPYDHAEIYWHYGMVITGDPLLVPVSESRCEFRRYVSTTGGNIYPYSSPALAALSIQDAIDAAVDGDSIMVETGTYNEKVTVQKPVYILGGWDVGFSARNTGAYPTTINSFGSTVSFINGAGTGSGIEGCIIAGSFGSNLSMPESGTYGGGILSYEASPVIKDNTINGCGYITSSGYSAGGGIACYLGTVEIIDNRINNCVAQSGGGVYLYQVTAELSGNTITGSHPHADYTGIRNGGGICARCSDLTMSGNVITGNTGYVNGGGIYSRIGSVSLYGDTISSNSCSGSGGGLLTERSAFDASLALITGNSAGTGGAIYHKSAPFDMANTLVAQNTVSMIGGGVMADSLWGTIDNNTFDGNSSPYFAGSMTIGNSEGCVIRNNHFTNNAPTGFQASAPENITYIYNNAYNNPDGDVLGMTPDGTNMSADPLYVDLPGGDYHLALHSPGIDRGDPGAGNDPDGSRADIGMYGGPDALWQQPDYVMNCVAAVSNDTITVTWDEMLSSSVDYFAVFGDTASGFDTDAVHLLGTVSQEEISFDHNPVNECWYYRVCAVNLLAYSGGYSNEAAACAASSTTDAEDIPLVTTLRRNYPNPFNGHTTISYSLDKPEHVMIRIYDTAGRLVRILEDSDRAAGTYALLWNGRNEESKPVASGVYFMKMDAGSYSSSRKIVYLR
ncbi:MAG: T9SS type A sorting domain-containing protein [Candidatus Krumholzibacteriota bacterium]|nr:T9SS type A sorting domain-containing protein [Candidatus Krumholzibacteriota bacterium]